MGTQGYNDFRADQLQLPLEEGKAVYDLIGTRIAVVRGATLENIADEDVLSGHAHSCDDVVEQLSRPADERPAGCVFVGSGGFAYENKVGGWIAFARHGVGAGFVQSASTAGAHFRCNCGQPFLNRSGYLTVCRFFGGGFTLGGDVASHGEVAGEESVHLGVLSYDSGNVLGFVRHVG